MDKVLFALSLQACLAFISGQDTHLFEYEYRVLDKLLELKNNQTILYGRIAQLEKQNANMLKDAERARETFTGGSVYVRWGRTTCPDNGTELVYDGYAAGGHYTESGAAAEYICLPKNPQWGYYDDSFKGHSLIYGAEYEFDGDHFFANGGGKFNQDVPCAVCRSSRPTVFMLPARKECPVGWTTEYWGYLSSGYVGHNAASQYVCLDQDLEVIIGGSANQNGKLFHLVEGVCGSLPCDHDQYVHGRELTCCVCTI